MFLDRKDVLRIAVVLSLLSGGAVARGGVPAWLPRYDVVMDVDVAGHCVTAQLRATWTNPCPTPTDKLVFNAHSHYVVANADFPLMAKTLEILRVNPMDELGETQPACEVRKVTLVDPTAAFPTAGEPGALAPGGQAPSPTPSPGADAPGSPAAVDAPFHYEGDTNTTLVVPLPRPVRQGETVSVVLDIHMKLPQKQGRWGQWRGVTFLTNWLPVFAYYGEPPEPPPLPSLPPRVGEGGGGGDKLRPDGPCWQPTPFVAWHLPFFNEAGVYTAHINVPAEQRVACTGSVVDDRILDDGRRHLDIRADGVRDFAFLCSAEYHELDAVLQPCAGVSHPIRVHVLALPRHEEYAKKTLKLACDALTTYGKWFGPYPYDDFTVAESFFGWNGNQLGMMVMIDERVFGLPQVGGGFFDYLIVHEICHQWWYNVVGVNGYCESFMDEGLATYFSKRLLNETVGRDACMMQYPQGLEWLPNVRRLDYHAYGMYGTFGRGENGPIVQDMHEFGNIVNLFSMAYDKGARVMGMVEERMGPAAFLDFMRVVYDRYQYRVLRVADFQHELEAYTGHSWEQFFHDWLYGPGLTDWAVEDVRVQAPPSCCKPDFFPWWKRRHSRTAGPNKLADAEGKTRVIVTLWQKGPVTDQTDLGFAVPGSPGYPIKIPIWPQTSTYQGDDPIPYAVEVLPDNRVRVEALLPEEPTQIAVDPDQVLIDRDPTNNFWKPPVRFRFSPVYTFLDETDLTNYYDRWNIIFGPWFYGSSYDDAWYTRSTMFGVRAGAYRTQQFDGGMYAAYRTDYSDVVVGADGLWDHVVDPHVQVGFNAEQRLTTGEPGDDHAFRGELFGRYIFLRGDSLYLQPTHFIEAFAEYQNDFLPFPKETAASGERFDDMTTAGLHYRLDYLTPYWDPEIGLRVDALLETGTADLQRVQAFNEASLQLSAIHYLPDLAPALGGCPLLQGAARPALQWLSETRVAARIYGATAAPSRGEFFALGGANLFRGFDQAQREGSSVWVGSIEWRVPIVKGLTYDACDHVVGLRGVYGAAFYDVGDAYLNGHSVGPTAHALGAGLRFDVTWFGFVERTTLRFDVAQTINDNTPTQFIFAVGMPF